LALAALADSIRERGVLWRVIVRPVDDDYKLVAGERRWPATRLPGGSDNPVLVDDALDGRRSSRTMFPINASSSDPTGRADANRD
jgi:ParB-like chromosome segregation protein Spo0J